VSTANNLRFDDGTVFKAGAGSDSTLTIAPPAAFGFLGTTRATVAVTDGAFLATVDEPSLSVTAGDVLLNRGNLSTDGGGSIRVVAVGADAVEVPLTGAVPAAHGRLDVLHGAIILSTPFEAQDGGGISVSAGQITIDRGGSTLTGIASVVLPNVSGNAGAVTVAAADSLQIVNGGIILSRTLSAGNTGLTSVSARTITIDSRGSSAFTGIDSEADAGTSGNLGNVNVTVRDKLSLLNGGAISTLSKGTGAAGRMLVSAEELVVDREGSTVLTGIASRTEAAMGAGADVEVSVGRLSLLGGGMIFSATNNAARAGSILVDADTIMANEQGTGSFTGILSQTAGGTGAAGRVEVTAAHQITLLNGSGIGSWTLAAGKAAAVKVSAESILIDEQTNPELTGIFSQALDGTGDAGNVEVSVAGNLTMLSGGGILTDTFARGHAGSIKVSAGSITIDGAGSPFSSGIGTQAEPGSAGTAGDIEVTVAGHLTISNGAISSSSFGGNAGNVTVSAGSATIDRRHDAAVPAEIAASVFPGSTGSAGDVVVSVSGLLTLLDGGVIASATASAGDAGSVRVNAGELVIDDRGGGFRAGIFATSIPEASGDAGRVTVAVQGQLSVVNGGSISSHSASPGSAGSVSVHAGRMLLSGGENTSFTGISSQAEVGNSNAGTIDVSVDGHLSIVNGAQISSTTFAGDAGTVEVTAGSIDIERRSTDRLGGIYATAQADSKGHAGNVIVSTAGLLSLGQGAQIASSTFAAGDGGSVNVTAGDLVIDDRASSLFAGIFATSESIASGVAGSLEVSVARVLSVRNGGQISSSTFSSGQAGSLQVSAGSIALDRGSADYFTGIVDQANVGSTGDAGSIQVSAARDLSIVNGAQIASSTFGRGKAGTVKVRADSMRLDGGADAANTGIFSDSEPSASGAAGHVEVNVAKHLAVMNAGLIASNTFSAADAGNVTVAAQSIAVVNGGGVASSTFGGGNAGSVEVTADRIAIDGHGNDSFNTGILAQAGLGSSGHGGDVRVSATRDVALLNGGRISTSTNSRANAGSVSVSAGSMSIDDQGSGMLTGIDSGTFVGSGDAGNVAVSVSGALSIVNGDVSSNSSRSTGKAGSVSVTAGSIGIVGPRGSIAALSGPGSGDAGDVLVSVPGVLSLTNGSSIAASTFSAAGNSGSVTVHAGTLNVDGDSAILAAAGAQSSGQTGTVSVDATRSITLINGGSLSIENEATVARPERLQPTLLSVSAPSITLTNGGEITAQSSGNVSASDIQVHFTDRLVIDPSRIITSANEGNGGSIRIDGSGVLVLDHSLITTSVAGLSGNGGDITINAGVLVMNSGFIQANTAGTGARGGNVAISVQSFVPSGGTVAIGGAAPLVFQGNVFGLNVIQAAAPTGVSGIVNVNSPVADIAGSLRALSTEVVSFGALGKDLCRIGAGSSLTPLGRGGLRARAAGMIRPEGPSLAGSEAKRSEAAESPAVGHQLTRLASHSRCDY
jgi:hypothetical protein